MLNRKVLLNSGFNMPMIGIGTGGLNTRRDIFETFENAIKVGYRHIDMATVYNNQELIGDYMFEKYLEDPKLKREDFFLCF
ncbi:hypothetical protein EDEG_00475 [Edhazardia aedis USNM 41457]|uniref:NADP-dependent oxidoreductase domain-containing protein n=1 Tax=Edhazardia aedis (strain USNM 41457) TaxID=1003232 RepID=J9DFH2_EDHAE|nr:hypothetical protein EDEG_00475 [Edhazardia aedis USNM 41457]|eukprot:EJW01350.1 hypothetical protein EDEG_00475 [Edhazardia aedis USNM 41457]